MSSTVSFASSFELSDNQDSSQLTWFRWTGRAVEARGCGSFWGRMMGLRRESKGEEKERAVSSLSFLPTQSTQERKVLLTIHDGLVSVPRS